MECLRPNVATHHLVAQLHDKTSDARMIFEHLYEGLAGDVSFVARHHGEKNLLFFAKVEGGVLLPEIQESLGHRLRRIDLVFLRCPPEPAGVHQTMVVILRKRPQFWGALHRVSLPLPSVHKLTSITKIGRLCPRVYAFPVAEKLLLLLIEPTSGLEPLTCSLRVIIYVLQGFVRGCKSRISKGLSLPWLALCCTVLRSRWYQSGIRS